MKYWRSKGLVSYVFGQMHPRFHVCSLYLFVVALDAVLLRLLRLLHFLIVISHHLLIGLSVHRRLSQRLLPAPFLNLHYRLRFLVLANVLSYRLLLRQLFAGPPNSSPFIKYFKILSLKNLQLYLLFQHQDGRLPFRQLQISRISLHHSLSDPLYRLDQLLFIRNLLLEYQDLLARPNCLEQQLLGLSRQDEAVSLVVLVSHVSIGRLYYWLTGILQVFFFQMNELAGVFLEVLPGNSLKVCWLENAFIGQLLDTPDQSIQIDSQIIHQVRIKVLSKRTLKTALTFVSTEHSTAKPFAQDFLQISNTINQLLTRSLKINN